MTRTGDLGPVRSGSVRAVQKGRTVTFGPARSGSVRQIVNNLFYNNKIRNSARSALGPDFGSRRLVNRTGWGYGHPPLGGGPSLPTGHAHHIPAVRTNDGDGNE